MVIILCFGLKIIISVLLVFKLILFALSHCTRSAKSWFIKEFIFFSDLFINSRMVSSAKWCTSLEVTYRFKSLINIINSRGPSTDACGTPWVISWELEPFPVILVYCFLSVRNEQSQQLAFPYERSQQLGFPFIP